jgi:CRP-like cAMP-binding protein
MNKKEKDEIVRMLQAVPMFSSLSKSHLRTLADEGSVESFPADKVIVKEGGTGSAFYIVLKGKVQAKRGTKVLDELERGQFFGEIAVLDGRPRLADVIAKDTTECLILPLASARSLLQTLAQTVEGASAATVLK